MSGSLDVAGELDYSQRAVPASGRMPELNLTMGFWAVCSAMFFLIMLLLSPHLELFSAPATVISSFALFWALSDRAIVAKPA